MWNDIFFIKCISRDSLHVHNNCASLTWTFLYEVILFAQSCPALVLSIDSTNKQFEFQNNSIKGIESAPQGLSGFVFPGMAR